MRLAKPFAAVLLALLLASPLSAKGFDKQAAEARVQKLPAVTIFVDTTWGNRTNGAAKALTEAHAAFGREGYELVNVAAYDENGDLQGFFVSYRQRAGGGVAVVTP